MNINERERKILKLGGIAAVIIFTVSYIITPILRERAKLQQQLAPKQQQIAMLRQSVHGPDSLLNRREVLARRLGSLLGGAPVIPPKQKTTEPPDEGSEINTEQPTPPADPPKETSEVDTKQPTQDTAKETSEVDTKQPTPPPDPPKQTSDIATYLAKAAATAGAKIKRITPKRTKTQQRSNQFFTPTTLTVSIETNPLNLIKMLYELEYGNRFIRLDRLSYRRDTSKNTVNVDFDVIAYQPAGS